MAKKNEKGLNPQQKKFCEIYATETEFFGNGVQSYIKAYNIDTTKAGAYNSARVDASKLLTKANILAYIDELLEVSALNEAFIDKQLAFLITQNADFGSKLGAIKEVNKLKQRITEKLDVTSKGESVNRTELTPEQVKNIAKDIDDEI